MKNYDEFAEWVLFGAKHGELGDESEYPIAGCRGVAEYIARRIKQRCAERVLCIGPASELAARQLYAAGHDIWLMDSDDARLELLQREMPEAHMLNFDFFGELPDSVFENTYEAIICTYVMHAIDDEDKLLMIEDLAGMLDDNGVLYLGDVCFWSRAEREICRRRCGEEWDDEACYIVYDDFGGNFNSEYISFTRVSHCAGVIELGDVLPKEK